MVTGLFVAAASVTVIVPFCVPAPRPVMSTDSVTVPVLVPLAGDRLSHVASSVTAQFSVPPPVLEIVRFWVAGLAPPTVAVKAKLVGEAPMVGTGGGAALRVSETGMVTGLFVAPAALTVIVPFCGPAESPAMSTDSVTVPPFVPFAGDRLSHGASSLTDQFKVPLPVLEMVSA
jgi:hypothetical protein